MRLKITNGSESGWIAGDPALANAYCTQTMDETWLPSRLTGFAEEAGWVSISSRTSGSGGVWHSGLRWSVRPEIENIRFVPELSDLSSLKRWYSGRSAWIIRALPGNTLEAAAIVQGNKQQRFFMRVRVVWDGTVDLSGFTSF